MTAARDLVVALGESMGLDELLVNDYGIATIRFDDLVVCLHADDDTQDITIFLAIGEIPPDADGRMAAYVYMLKADNFSLHTGGGVLGIDDKETTAFFSRRFPAASLTVGELERIVEAFLNVADVLVVGFRHAVKAGGSPIRRTAELKV